MTVNFTEAVAAYQRAAQKGKIAETDARPAEVAGDFAAMLRGAAEEAVDTLRAGEARSLEAAAGQADLNEVVVAVSRAEMTLQTLVTLRDRALQAYREILRMPI